MSIKKGIRIHSVKFNAMMNILLTGSNALLGVILIPYVSRVLTVEGNGAVSFAQSTASWISVFCLLGIPIYGVRECAKVRDDPQVLTQTVKELLTLVTIFTVIGLSIFALGIIFIPQLHAQSSLMCIFMVNILLTSYGAEWFFQAIEQYAYITIRSLCFKAISILLIFLLVRHESDFVLYGALLALGTCLNNILNIIRLNRIVDLSTVKHVHLKHHIKPFLSFGGSLVASSMYLAFDSVLLGLLSNGTFEVGLYQLVSKIKVLLGNAVTAVGNAMIPRLTYYVEHKQFAKYYELLRKNILISLLFSTAICSYLLVYADQTILLLSSAKFIQATIPLQIISFVVLFASLNVFNGYMILTPLGKEAALAKANFVGVPVSIISNVILDSYLGAIGAAISILLTEFSVFLFQSYYAKNEIKKVLRARDLLFFGGVATVVYICLQLTKSVFLQAGTFFSLILSFTLAATIYLVTFAVCYFFTKQKKRILTFTEASFPFEKDIPQ